jgi:cupin fold WbuC family metalloprotein
MPAPGTSTLPSQPANVAVEEFRDDGRVVCLVVRSHVHAESTRFFTSDDSTLQVGLVVHPQGHVIPRHRHVPIRREISETGEVLVVRRGRCTLELFSRSGDPLSVIELEPDDLVVLSGAAHRFTMHSDTILLEVKQGPYTGPAEKELF